MRHLSRSLRIANTNGREIMELAMEATKGTKVSRVDSPRSADETGGREEDEDSTEADPQLKHLTS